MTVRRSALGPAQAAVYQWLAADSQLIALAPVHDFIDEATPMPYVEISELIETLDNTEGVQGREVQVTIFAWSRQPGFKELETILDHLMRLLDEGTIVDATPYEGWHINYNEVTRSEVTRLPDGQTRQLGLQVSMLVTRDDPGE